MPCCLSTGDLNAAVNLSAVYSTVVFPLSTTLTVRDIALAQVFMRNISRPISLFAMGPNSTLDIQDVVMRTSLTPPLQVLLDGMLAAPRLARAPGTQQARLVPASVCWPTPGLLLLSAPCYSQALVVDDVALALPASFQLPGRPFGSYVLTMRNVTLYSDLEVPIDCVVQNGFDVCYQQFLAALQNRGLSWVQLWVAPLILGSELGVVRVLFGMGACCEALIVAVWMRYAMWLCEKHQGQTLAVIERRCRLWASAGCSCE